MVGILSKNRKLIVFLVPAAIMVMILFGFVTSSQANSKKELGKHTLFGTYMFHADGAVENESGGYIRGMWEVGRFEADGKGNIKNGVEYSSLLGSSDPDDIDHAFSFSGRYNVRPDGTAKAHVKVIVSPTLSIEKDLWFVVHSVGKDGIAYGFAGGHADAVIGEGVHGNSQSHVGWRIDADHR